MFNVLEKRTVNESTKYHLVGSALTLEGALEICRIVGPDCFVIDADGNPINYSL